MYTLVKRYEVQIQEDCYHHPDTDDLAQEKYYARSLANWNVPAQVFDRATQKVIFRDRPYVEKIRLLIDGPGTNQSAEDAGIPKWQQTVPIQATR